MGSGPPSSCLPNVKTGFGSREPNLGYKRSLGVQGGAQSENGTGRRSLQFEQKMRNYLWVGSQFHWPSISSTQLLHLLPLQLAVLLVVATTCIKAKPLVSFGVSYQQPYLGPQPESYYYGGRYPAGGYYNNYHNSPGPYGYPYPYANRYGALDLGIGALSLSSFLL